MVDQVSVSSGRPEMLDGRQDPGLAPVSLMPEDAFALQVTTRPSPRRTRRLVLQSL